MLSLTESTLFFLGLRKSSKKFALGGEVKSWIVDVTEAFQAGDLNGPTSASKAGKATSSTDIPPQSLDTDSTLIGTLPSTATRSFINSDFVEDANEIFADIVDDAAEKSATIGKFGMSAIQTVQVSLLSFNYISIPSQLDIPLQLATVDSESDGEPEMMGPPFTQWPSTTAAQTIQVNSSFIENTLRLN